MSKYVMLTQDNCKNCDMLKMLLAKPMKGQFDDVITKVHRQSDEEKFREYVHDYQIGSVPVIINTESKKVLRDFSSGVKVKTFLTE